MKHRMIDQVMSRDVIRAGPGDAYQDVARLLARHAISGVPVVDDDDKVLGVISETDLIYRQASQGKGQEPGQGQGQGRDEGRGQGPGPGPGPAGPAAGGPGEPAASRSPALSRPPGPWYARAPISGLAQLTRRGRRDRTKARAGTADQLMSAPARTIGPRQSVAEAARVMAAHHVERLPVVDDEGRLMGIVTRSDLLSVFRRPDERIRDEIIEEVLVRTLWLAPHTIDVEIRDGVATLTGTLRRRSEAAIAVRLTGRVDGVVSVIDHLGYQEDDSHLRPTEQALHGITEQWLRRP